MSIPLLIFEVKWIENSRIPVFSNDASFFLISFFNFSFFYTADYNPKIYSSYFMTIFGRANFDKSFYASADRLFVKIDIANIIRPKCTQIQPRVTFNVKIFQSFID